MFWFDKEKKKKMEFIQSYIPTSKAQLLQVAMWYHQGDIQKAQEMFEFYNKNLNLPDFDPVQPSFMQQFKDNANSFFSWIKENRGDIVNGYQFVQSVISNRGVIPTIATEAEEEALPPINE